MNWQTLNEVPNAIKLHKGARLDLYQVEEVTNRAYELQIDGNPNLGVAWVEFEQKYAIESGLWVLK